MSALFRNRPVVFVANSSYYLNHYRSHLISRLASYCASVIALSPYDRSSLELSQSCLFIPWRVERSRSLSVVSFAKSFIRLFFLIRAVKPSLVHSHTLQPNLISSLVCCFFDIPIVLSFTGLGRLSTSKNRLYMAIFFLILNVVAVSCLYHRVSRIRFQRSNNRSVLLFQNENDLRLFKSLILTPFRHSLQFHRINGSGVPSRYFTTNKSLVDARWPQPIQQVNIHQVDFIFCARLLRSKGVMDAIRSVAGLTDSRLHVYGSIDPASDDSLALEEVKDIESRWQNISFYGHVQDPLIDLDFRFPILLVPSLYGEGFPRGIIEAFSRRIPVIATRVATVGTLQSRVHILDCWNSSTLLGVTSEIIEKYESDCLENSIISNLEYTYNAYSEEHIVAQTLNLYESIGYKKSAPRYLASRDEKLIYTRL